MTSSDLTIRYFTSYSGARLPLNLVGELAADDMRNRNTFYRGAFDAGGLLKRCEKVFMARSRFVTITTITRTAGWPRP